jgi:hypothetical protein
MDRGSARRENSISFFLGGSETVHLVRRPLTGLLYQPRMIDDMCSSRWNENWQEKSKYSEKTCPSATLSTTNATWPDLSSNPGRRGSKPAINRLRYGTALGGIRTHNPSIRAGEDIHALDPAAIVIGISRSKPMKIDLKVNSYPCACGGQAPGLFDIWTRWRGRVCLRREELPIAMRGIERRPSQYKHMGTESAEWMGLWRLAASGIKTCRWVWTYVC